MGVSTRVRLNEGSVMWPEIPVQSSAGNILQQITTDNRVNKKYNIQYYFMKYNVIDHSINSVYYTSETGDVAMHSAGQTLYVHSPKSSTFLREMTS